MTFKILLVFVLLFQLEAVTFEECYYNLEQLTSNDQNDCLEISKHRLAGGLCRQETYPACRTTSSENEMYFERLHDIDLCLLLSMIGSYKELEAFDRKYINQQINLQRKFSTVNKLGLAKKSCASYKRQKPPSIEFCVIRQGLCKRLLL